MPQVVAVAAAWVAKTITVKAVTAFVVKTVLQIAATVALSKAAKALGLSKQSIQERQASVTQLSLGEVPREAVLGIACTGGSLLDAFNFGGKYGTDTVTRVIELADHLLDGIVGYYVDDVYYAWTGDGVQPGFNGKLSIEFKNGFAAGNVPPLHVRQNGGWSANDVLAGVAYVVVDTRFDDTVWTQGHPRFKFVVRGLRVYDPRRDPALGYTGANPQTWADTSTHTFSRNAALLRYAYTRGIYATGHQGEPQHLLIGRGLSAEEAPPARIIAAANLCDEAVDGEIRYTADGVISANQAYIEVEELFAAAMAGVIVQREGGVEIEPGQAKATVVTITDGDLVIGKPIGAAPFLPDSDGGRINTIVPRYVEPAQGWLDHAAPVIRDLSRMAPAPVGDGGPREMTLALALVIRAVQANGNGAIALRKAALERRATITLPPRFAGLEEGDWIAWKSDRRHGGATVRYRVVSFSLSAEWQNSLVLEEIASSVYGVPDPVEDRALPPPAPTPIDALQLFGVQAEAITLAGETSALPAVRFTWDVDVEDTAITAIRAEVRKVGTTDIAPTRFDDPKKGTDVASAGVWPDSQLECRLVPLGDPSRPVLPSNWITVSTSSLIAGGIGSERAAEVVAAVKQLRDVGQGVVANAFAILNETLEDLAEGVLDNTSENENLNRWINQVAWIDGEKVGTYAVRRTTALDDGLTLAVQDIVALGARTDAAFAGYEAEINLVIDGLNAEVEARTVFQAETETSFGGVLDTLSVMAGDLAAEIQQRETLAVIVEDNQAAVLSSISLVADALSVEAERIDGLLISSGENAAAIVTERDARLSDISGLVSEITALSLDFDGQQASITVLNELTGDLETGLNAVVGLVLDVDGYAVGVRAANDGTVGSLKLLFDALDFVDPNGGDPIAVISYGLDNVLTLQDVVIRNAAVIGDLTVRGEAIVRDVVTPLTATYVAASISLNGTMRTTVAEVVVATTGKQLNIRFNGLIDTRHEPASSYTLFVELRRQTAAGVGDLQIDYGSVDAPGNTADNIVAKWPIDVLDRPSAGTYRYYVDVWTSSTNMTVQAVRQRFMSAMELRTNS